MRGCPPQKGVCRRFQRRPGGRPSPTSTLPDEPKCATWRCVDDAPRSIFAEERSVLEPDRFRLEFELARIVPNDADITFCEASGGLGFDLEGQRHLSSLGPLQLHNDGVQYCVE